MELSQEIQVLAQEFAGCRKILAAMGDQNRQHLILEMLGMGRCEGVRVGEIAARTHLSRPAVSHHLWVLREAGIVRVRREGTRNYYCFDAAGEGMASLLRMLTHAAEVMSRLPSREGEEEESE